MAVYWSSFHFWPGVPLCNSLLWGESMNFGLRNLALWNRNITIVWCTTYLDTLNQLGVGHHQCDRRTDGQNYDINSVHLTTRAKNDACLKKWALTLSHKVRLENISTKSVVLEPCLIELHLDTRSLVIERNWIITVDNRTVHFNTETFLNSLNPLKGRGVSCLHLSIQV